MVKVMLGGGLGEGFLLVAVDLCGSERLGAGAEWSQVNHAAPLAVGTATWLRGEEVLGSRLIPLRLAGPVTASA